MHKRFARALAIAAMLPIFAASGAGHAHASPYATHHADMLWVTPYLTQVTVKVGDYAPDPSPGNEYLVLWVQATNRNDVPMNTTDKEFHLDSPNGQAIDSDFNTPSPAYAGITLNPGGSTKGTITFQVPKGTHSAVLRWAPDSHWTDLQWPVYRWTIRY